MYWSFDTCINRSLKTLSALAVPSSFSLVDRPLDILIVLFEDFRPGDGSSSLKTVDEFTLGRLLVLLQLLVARLPVLFQGGTGYWNSPEGPSSLTVFRRRNPLFFLLCGWTEAAGYYRRDITTWF